MGAGLAGLSIGVNLTRRGSPVVFIEKESEVGGLAKSHSLQKVIFDYGPHVLRSSDENLVEWISSLVKLRQYHTRAAIYKYGKLFDFVIPVIPWSDISRLPSSVVSKVQTELKSLKAPPTPSGATNFQDFIIERVGRTLYWEFFGEYSAKWWGVNPKSLSIDLAPRGLVIGNAASYAHITTSFAVPKREFYPENGGYGSIGQALYKILLGKDTNFLLNSNVTHVETDGQSVTKVWLGESQEIEVKGRLFSSVPLPIACSMLGIRCGLRFRSHIACFLVFPKDAISVPPFSWIYFPEDNFTFHRLYRMGEFSENNEPGRLGGIVAELTCFPNDPRWKMKEQDLAQKICVELSEIGFARGPPDCWKVMREKYAYPLLDLDYRERKREIMEKIKERAQNLAPIGRSGAFNYWNSDSVLSYFNTETN
jgi:protoporphyrinogen oxidase